MLRIGILGGADIAFRMFLPALLKTPDVCCAGVASSDPERRARFSHAFAVPVFTDYNTLIEDNSVDAVYVPLPPALHYKWAEKALQSGKHVLLEKPATTARADSEALVALAGEKQLALHENYMFRYHSQLGVIRDMLAQDAVGEIRLYRGGFGFPRRQAADFRYNKALGGGALLDVGGYVIKLALLLLGGDAALKAASLCGADCCDVDLFGSVTLEHSGRTYQGAFGMDNQYQCALEVWGSKGYLRASRIFTAPPGFSPPLMLETAQGARQISLAADDHFAKSIAAFAAACSDDEARIQLYGDILLQARTISAVRSLAEKGAEV